MPCYPILIDGKPAGLLCGIRRSRHRAKCDFSGAPSDLLCDGPGKKPGTTCDNRICGECAETSHAGRKRRDLCPVCEDLLLDARAAP